VKNYGGNDRPTQKNLTNVNEQKIKLLSARKELWKNCAKLTLKVTRFFALKDFALALQWRSCEEAGGGFFELTRRRQTSGDMSMASSSQPAIVS